MPKKSVVYYDPLGANPWAEGVSHVVITPGAMNYVSAIVYSSCNLEMAAGKEHVLLSIERARRRFYFEEIPVPEIAESTIREFAEDLERRLSKKSLVSIKRRRGRGQKVA